MLKTDCLIDIAELDEIRDTSVEIHYIRRETSIVSDLHLVLQSFD